MSFDPSLKALLEDCNDRFANLGRSNDVSMPTSNSDLQRLQPELARSHTPLADTSLHSTSLPTGPPIHTPFLDKRFRSAEIGFGSPSNSLRPISTPSTDSPDPAPSHNSRQRWSTGLEPPTRSVTRGSTLKPEEPLYLYPEELYDLTLTPHITGEESRVGELSSLKAFRTEEQSLSHPCNTVVLGTDQLEPGECDKYLEPLEAETVGNLNKEPQYVIEVRQQPVAALYSIEGNHERDPRTIINPLPIIQLLVKGSTVVPSNFRDYYQGLAVRCFLRGENAFLANQNEQVTDTDRLLGTVIRSPVIGRDEDGGEGSFFCFSDLSCTTPGNYRLYFELILSDMKKPLVMRTPDDVPKSGIIAWTQSGVFAIYTAEEFPGGGPMTALTKALKRQGCITVENSNESKDKGNPVKFRLGKSFQPQSGGGETQKTLPKNISNATEIDKTIFQPEQNEPPKLQRLRSSEAEISGIDNTRTESPPAYPPPPGVISSEEELAKQRAPTIHPSKKTQAFKRPRGPDGRFIRADDVTNIQRSQNQYQGLHVYEKGNSLGQTKPDQKNTKTKTFEAEHQKRAEPYSPRPMQRIASGTVGTGEKVSESLQKGFPPIKQKTGAKEAELYTSQSSKGHGATLKKIGEQIHADMGRYSTSSSAKTPITTTPTLPFATDSSVLPPYQPTSIRQISQPKRVSSHDSYIAKKLGYKKTYNNSMDRLKLRHKLRHQTRLTKLKAKPPSNKGEDLIPIGLPSLPHNQPVTTTKYTTEADHDTHNSSLRWIKHVPINIYIDIRSTEDRFRSCVCSIMSLAESPRMHQTFQTSFKHQVSSTLSYIRDLLGELALYLEHLDERVGNEASGSLPSVVKKVTNVGGNCNEPEAEVDGDEDQLENMVSDLSGFVDSLDALRSALTMASKPSLGFQQGLLMA